jgi:hypothetical protein
VTCAEQYPVLHLEEDLPRAWWADIRHEEVAWWQQGWQATPAPATPTEPKLIPIVTTAEQIDAVALAQTYIHRWPAQENVIKDFLLPLGLDVNHGFAKTPVENSEVAKKREALEKRLANVQRYGEAAREKAHRGSQLATKLWKQTKEHGEALYRLLNERLQALEAQGVTEGIYRVERKKLKAEADAELEPLWQRVYRVQEKSHQESSKHKPRHGWLTHSGSEDDRSISDLLWRGLEPSVSITSSRTDLHKRFATSTREEPLRCVKKP